MAMTAVGLANEIFTQMEAVYGDMTEGKPETMKYLTVFSTAIVNYLKANADILPGTFTNGGGNVAGTGKVT
jgi:hypothetical protein